MWQPTKGVSDIISGEGDVYSLGAWAEHLLLFTFRRLFYFTYVPAGPALAFRSCLKGRGEYGMAASRLPS